MRHFWAYLKHWWRANTLHGTHSPFVYSLLERVVYDRKNYSAYHQLLPVTGMSTKELRLIWRLLQDRKPQKIWLHPNIASVWKEWLLFGAKGAQISSDTTISYIADLFILPAGDWTFLPKVSPEGMGIIIGLRSGDEALKNWRTMTADKSLSVSIDFFSLGCVFFHSWQEKEAFEIRF